MTTSEANLQLDCYLNHLLRQVYSEVPRLLSLMDNRKQSKTYGCFFPKYWREKQENFVNARAQEAALTLAMLYSYEYPGNAYYGDNSLLSYSVAGLEYWTKLQHRDGSFDEWRKFEHGQACTAFSTLAMIDTYKLMKNFLREDLKRQVLTCFKKSAIFLSRNPDKDFINHEAVAIAAVYSCYELFGHSFFLLKTKEKIRTLPSFKHFDGGFKEGYGVDSGYNTITLTHLAMYYKRSRDKSILPLLKKALIFNSFFIYPDGFTGGGFNSRQAGMLFPLGFFVLSRESRLASHLAQKSLHSLIKKMRDFFTLSDMRRCITLYDVLRSYLEARNCINQVAKLPSEREDRFTRYMRESGIVVVKTPYYYLTIGTKKACIGSIYSYGTKNTIHISSPNMHNCTSGIFGLTNEGLLVSNIDYTSSFVSVGKNSISTILNLPLIDPELGRRWMKNRLIDKPPLLEMYHIFRALGFGHAISSYYDRFCKDAKKQHQKPVLRLIRTIRWTENTINLLNDIVFLKQLSYKELYLGETFIIQKGLSELVNHGNTVMYKLGGDVAMIMSTLGNNIEIRSGEQAGIRFNDAQPMIVRIPLEEEGNKIHVRYTLEIC